MDTLKELEDMFSRQQYKGHTIYLESEFQQTLKLLQGIDLKERDVQQFIDKTLVKVVNNEVVPFSKRYEDKLYHEINGRNFAARAGMFLSALIQNSSLPEMSLSVEAVPMQTYAPCIDSVRPIDYLCCFLKDKKITIIGDTGERFGYKLNGANLIVLGNSKNHTLESAVSGKVVIKGNASAYDGDMLSGAELIIEGNVWGYLGYYASAGTIVVKGNSYTCTGQGLKGAKIFVEGNVGEGTARYATSGEIHVGGEIRGLTWKPNRHVKIFRKGKKYWPTAFKQFVVWGRQNPKEIHPEPL